MEYEIPLTSPLLTDRYLLTMCYSFFKSGKHTETAVYEIFFRKNPFESEYTVICGINETIDWIKRAKFLDREIDFVCQNLSLSKENPFISWLRSVDFSQLKVWAVKEGSIVFPYIPLIVLEGPLALVQLTETLILNKLNYPSLIATNARLLKTVIGSSELYEFGLRRAQGPDGGTIGALYAFIGGAQATSNMLTGMRYGVPVIGTMAHSYITSFSSLAELDHQERSDDERKFISQALEVRKELGLNHTNDGELAAFISYSLDFPDNCICLIDTYDTIKSGALNYCVVAVALERIGKIARGIRLDSGDLAKLSIEVKKIFQEIGAKSHSKIAEYSRVVASDDLSIKKIKAMEGKHSIDFFAVGTKLITCYEQAALGMVCKLCSLNGDPRLKFSETVEKSTLPGKKQVIRALIEHNGVKRRIDVICEIEEKSLEQSAVIYLIHKYDDPVTVSPIEQEALLLDCSAQAESFVFNPIASKTRVEASYKEYEEQLARKEGNFVYISSRLRGTLLKVREKLSENN